MKIIKLMLAGLALLMAFTSLSAQNYAVSGVVTDATSGEPVPFAFVRVVGTKLGAAADADGKYVVSASADARLEFSSIGYATVILSVDGRSVVDCRLTQDADVLDDVVVVAYGSSKREAMTGAVSAIRADRFAYSPVTSVEKALSGKLAGVQVTSTSGQPGSYSQIRVRGNGSINSSNAPLWVVDGIPVSTSRLGKLVNTSNELADLNPNDIESISVLKDAAAAAVYGSRAANGVILVTTKSGKAGESRFDAHVRYGLSWLQSDNSDFRMMTGEELLTYQRDAVYNAGKDPDDPTCIYYRPMSLLTGELTNWMNHFTRAGRLSEYELSARGGNDRGRYYSSFSYHRNEGVFYGVDFSRMQARVNADYRLLDNLETGARVNVSYTEQNDVPMQSLKYSNPIWAGQTLLPWIQKYDADGNHNVDIPSNSYQNPLATAEYDDQWQKSWKMNGTVFLKWEPLRNLVLETRNSIETSFGQERRYWNPKARGQASDATLQTYRNQLVNLTTSNTATWSDVFNGVHSVRVLAGQEANVYKTELSFIKALNVNPDIPYVNTATPGEIQASDSFSNQTLMSFFGIADYSYDNRYFLQLTTRADGSSLFGTKTKWGAFGSAAASWNVHNEDWFASAKGVVDTFKLRLSYGVNGNNGITPYKAYGLYTSSVYNGVSAMIPKSPANEQLAWEKNGTFNVGVDFGLIDRIHGSIDVYDRLTWDMLLNVKVPQTSGFSSNFMNAGSMRNRGVELQLDADLISTPDFNWNVGLNLAHNNTRILDLAVDPDDDGVQKIEPNSIYHYVVGRSLYSYYLADYYGVNPANGEALWVNEEGKLTNDYSHARKYYAGSPEPKIIGGFNTVINWKGLQLSADFEFKGGNYVLILNENYYLNSDGAQMQMNQMASSLNYWKKPGDVGCNPKPVAGNTSNSNAQLSDRWLERGDYLRLKDLTLSYALPKQCLGKINLKGLRFYVSGLNLYCLHDVNSWDPELGVTGTGAGIYPLTKSVVGGIEVSF